MSPLEGSELRRPSCRKHPLWVHRLLPDADTCLSWPREPMSHSGLDRGGAVCGHCGCPGHGRKEGPCALFLSGVRLSHLSLLAVNNQAFFSSVLLFPYRGHRHPPPPPLSPTSDTWAELARRCGRASLVGIWGLYLVRAHLSVPAPGRVAPSPHQAGLMLWSNICSWG